MRRTATLILALFMVFSLTSCVSSSKSADETAQDVRTRLQDSEISLTAELKANYGDRVYDFTLAYSTSSGIIEVKAPELLAGTTVTVNKEDGSTTLQYDGAELDTGALTEDGLSPVAALPTIVDQWIESYIIESFYESSDGTDFVAIRTQISDDVISTNWFDRSTGDPIKAEIATDDNVVIQCTFSGVSIT